MGTVEVGGVEKGDAGVEGVVDEFDHIGVGLRQPIESRHAHAPQPLFGHLKALQPELDSGHFHSHFAELGLVDMRT